MIPILETVAWQMTPGERAAFAGLLSLVRPKFAIEIGTADGGSLRWLAQHSDEVLSFDLLRAPSASY
jgi:predicted O-methyltransferase YrrM